LRLVLAWLRCFFAWWVLVLRDSAAKADARQAAQAA